MNITIDEAFNKVITMVPSQLLFQYGYLYYENADHSKNYQPNNTQ